MALTNTAKNSMLDQLGTLVAYLSLHTGDPSTSGANEVSGGTPTYARQAASWDAADSGSMSLDGVATFDVPSGTTVSHFGMWSASSGGTFLGGNSLTSSEAFTEQGQYILSDLDISI